MGHISRVIMPDSGKDLLREECAAAFTALGLQVMRPHPQNLWNEESSHYLPTLLRGEPALFFSINFSGLHVLKPVVQLLEAAKSAVAVWCVDNPWNLLSGVRDPLWKTLPLFVTDSFFIPGLQKEGAMQVAHLPLGTSLELFGEEGAAQKETQLPYAPAPVLFVGRSQFPGKEQFFAGCSVPDALQAEARAMLNAGQRPHLGWWEQAFAGIGAAGASDSLMSGGNMGELAYSGNAPIPGDGAASGVNLSASGRVQRRRVAPGVPPYWPGKSARWPALGAEETGLYWRSTCLEVAAQAFGAESPVLSDRAGGQTVHGAASERGSVLPTLDVVGDAGWQACLPQGARLSPPVDYYGTLPALYRAARCTLALTSLQLPHGLNQRHFDVWAAGGCAVTDATAGLALFPERLTRPVTFHTAEELPGVLRRLANAPAVREKLVAEWQEHIALGHTYTHRMQAVLAALGVL